MSNSIAALTAQLAMQTGAGKVTANTEQTTGAQGGKALGVPSGAPGKSFSDYLRENLSDINKMQKDADNMASDIASGKTENIHETMLALSQAELSFKLMVQVRNKALEAYQEVMRMPV